MLLYANIKIYCKNKDNNEMILPMPCNDHYNVLLGDNPTTSDILTSNVNFSEFT